MFDTPEGLTFVQRRRYVVNAVMVVACITFAVIAGLYVMAPDANGATWIYWQFGTGLPAMVGALLVTIKMYDAGELKHNWPTPTFMIVMIILAVYQIASAISGKYS